MSADKEQIGEQICATVQYYPASWHVLVPPLPRAADVAVKRKADGGEELGEKSNRTGGVF